MRRHLLALTFAALGLSMFACRSTDKTEGDASAVKSDEAQPAEPATSAPTKEAEGDKAKEAATSTPAANACAAKPEPVFCCEALTPSCNDCRDNAAKALAAWRDKCLKPAEQPKDCGGGAPVTECCTDSTDACRQCRDAAIQVLVEWKERCANIEAYPCDKQPPHTMCCQAMIPSCSTCQDRNRRITEDWERRCK